MGKRSTARKLAMQAMYQADALGAEISGVFPELFSRESYLPETVRFSQTLALGAWEKKEHSDKVIVRLSKGWSLDRMGKVVMSVLRLAIYELDFQSDTPSSVVIDEAVELAKKFATPEAGKFVNGILGSYLKEKKACSRE